MSLGMDCADGFPKRAIELVGLRLVGRQKWSTDKSGDDIRLAVDCIKCNFIDEHLVGRRELTMAGAIDKAHGLGLVGIIAKGARHSPHRA